MHQSNQVLQLLKQNSKVIKPYIKTQNCIWHMLYCYTATEYLFLKDWTLAEHWGSGPINTFGIVSKVYFSSLG